jgi:hypothetical protein
MKAEIGGGISNGTRKQVAERKLKSTSKKEN